MVSDISAARDTFALTGMTPKHLSALISGVLGAKFLLAVLCIAGAVFFSGAFTHHIAPSLALLWASTIRGVCQGINMFSVLSAGPGAYAPGTACCVISGKVAPAVP